MYKRRASHNYESIKMPKSKFQSKFLLSRIFIIMTFILEIFQIICLSRRDFFFFSTFFYIFYFYFFAIQTSYIMALNLLLDYTAYTHGLLRQCSRIPNWTLVGGTLPPSCVLKH